MEDDPLRTTTTTTASVAAATVSKDSEQPAQQEYQPRTLTATSMSSRRRRALLPAYPTHKYDTRPALLLLANVATVDRALLEVLSYSGDNNEGNLDSWPLKVELLPQLEFLPSFLADFYQKLYVNTSQRWRMPLSLIDYNLTRLHQCMDKYSKQVGEAAIALLDELPLALEFYLQIDVDLFFLKTCDFRDAQPRSIGQDKHREGLLCEAEPAARFGTRPCAASNCSLCQSERMKARRRPPSSHGATMPFFSTQQIHRFLNDYRAILNCPATCTTSNVIYALTCPCGEYDYVGSTAQPFVDRIAEHRDEGHRIIREFLFGPENMTFLLTQDKRKAIPLAEPYDRLLYQHSARCRYGLQRFLDRNPLYWCFVPQLCAQVQIDDDNYCAERKKKKTMDSLRATAMNPFGDAILLAEQTASSQQQGQQQQQQQHEDEFPSSSGSVALPLTASGKPMFFAAVVADIKRTNDETRLLVRQIPEPPVGYAFSSRQRNQQWTFFEERKETRVYPSDRVDLYNYSIVAVLSFNCSRDLRKFIEALFITHAETKLNLIGRLTHQHPAASLDESVRGNWCARLHRPSDQDPDIEPL